MLEKAIRKAVLSILLASLMVGAGCRITYAEEQQQTTESKVATDDTFVQAPSALLMEAGTGTVIYEKDPDTRRSPASITKIMTLILIFDALENGTLKMDEKEGETQDCDRLRRQCTMAKLRAASRNLCRNGEYPFCRLLTESDHYTTVPHCHADHQISGMAPRGRRNPGRGDYDQVHCDRLWK